MPNTIRWPRRHGFASAEALQRGQLPGPRRRHRVVIGNQQSPTPRHRLPARWPDHRRSSGRRASSPLPARRLITPAASHSSPASSWGLSHLRQRRFGLRPRTVEPTVEPPRHRPMRFLTGTGLRPPRRQAGRDERRSGRGTDRPSPPASATRIGRADAAWPSADVNVPTSQQSQPSLASSPCPSRDTLRQP